MTNEMRQELNGVKTAVGALGEQMNAIKTTIDALAVRIGDFALETSGRLGRLESITRNTAAVVAGHTEDFGQVKQRLTRLDELDGLKTSLEVFTAEIVASRDERALSGKSFA